MLTREILSELEDISIEAKRVNSLAGALFSAFYEGSGNYKEYEWAFDSMLNQAHNLSNKLTDLRDNATAIFRKEANK